MKKSKLITMIKESNALMNASKFVDDKTFLKIVYRIKMGQKLDLNNPKTFNEKLQWLKLHDRKDIYTTMVDKYEAKKYIADIIGEQYIIPTLGVYDRFDDIDFKKLPKQFVIKCTHDSGGLIVCKDKTKLNINEAKKKINKCMKQNFYYLGREWPYKNVKPKIIIERYMEDGSGYQLKDYKIFCFNGVPKIILICSERQTNLKETWFDEYFKKIDVTEGGHETDNSIKKPKELKEMMDLAKKLSKNMVFLRTDFYIVKNKVYFGEITLFPASGYERFVPEEWNRKLGDMIDLSPLKKEAN